MGSSHQKNLTLLGGLFETNIFPWQLEQQQDNFFKGFNIFSIQKSFCESAKAFFKLSYSTFQDWAPGRSGNLIGLSNES